MTRTRVTTAEELARLQGALLLLADAMLEAFGIYRIVEWFNTRLEGR